MSKQLCPIVLVLIFGTVFWPQRAVGGGLEISGIVQNPNGLPIPQAIVSIVSIQQRSEPAFTDGEGRFLIVVFPPVGPDVFLEIYWNRELMFRQPLIQLAIDRSQAGTGRDVFNSGGFVRLAPITVGLSP